MIEGGKARPKFFIQLSFQLLPGPLRDVPVSGVNFFFALKLRFQLREQEKHHAQITAVLALAFVLAPFCSAQTAQPAAAKRPMTFEDMMKMKRLGETAVSPDGKWLAYSVTTVNLDKNTKTAELWLQAIAGGEPMKLAVALPGDSGVQFAPDGKRILFLSGRVGSEQIWLADFDARNRHDEQREEADKHRD